jgi:hypothetical protein
MYRGERERERERGRKKKKKKEGRKKEREDIGKMAARGRKQKATLL